MQFSQKALSVKVNYPYALILISLISAIFAACSMTEGDDFDIARREMLIRRIGHEVLLTSGDSTSRVFPIKKIAENEYQISFEKELTFQTDSLVSTTQRLLNNDPFARDYVVNVVNCSNSNVVYGYAISKNKKEDIIACIGRKQPTACYIINIKFKPEGITTTKNKYILGGISIIALLGFIFLRTKKSEPSIANNEYLKTYSLGSFIFDAEKKQLNINNQIIELTGTETRLLLIFASSPNEIIERSRLQKEIWEDAGVIVGRSLDMFISKLRKKLEHDPNVNIVVIRSKGYKLELSA